MTKEEKRAKRKQDRGIVDFLMVQNHFFKELGKWIEEMKDPRNASYTTYKQTDLVYMGILKNVCSIESMRQMEEKFNESVCADTLNYYLERLSPECLSELRKKMTTSLIRGKQFYRNRLVGKYWRVILDGTGIASFPERHCENCLYETRVYKDGKKVSVYQHKVVEAKLILGENLS